MTLVFIFRAKERIPTRKIHKSQLEQYGLPSVIAANKQEIHRHINQLENFRQNDMRFVDALAQSRATGYTRLELVLR